MASYGDRVKNPLYASGTANQENFSTHGMNARRQAVSQAMQSNAGRRKAQGLNGRRRKGNARKRGSL